MNRPPWVREPISTRARLDPCPRCHAPTIRALDSPTAGLDVRLDPTPLGLAEELHARISGRMTYDLIGGGDRKEIALRDQWSIRQRKWPVLPAHKCPGVGPLKGPVSRPRRKERANDDRPPF